MSTVEFKGSLHFTRKHCFVRTSPGSGDGCLALNPLPCPDYLCDLGTIALYCCASFSSSVNLRKQQQLERKAFNQNNRTLQKDISSYLKTKEVVLELEEIQKYRKLTEEETFKLEDLIETLEKLETKIKRLQGIQNLIIDNTKDFAEGGLQQCL